MPSPDPLHPITQDKLQIDLASRFEGPPRPKPRVQGDVRDIAVRPLPPDGRHIRLMKLLPPPPPSSSQEAANGDGDRIEIELEVFSLDAELPDYSALSYTWLAERRDFSLEENIWSGGEAYPITANLRQGLARLRLPDKARYLWVDQVCIRQHDNGEKSHQLPLMSEVYRRAPLGVIAWLGSDKVHAPYLMQYMSYILGTRLWDQEKFDLSPLLTFDNEEDLKKGRQALVSLLSKRWFSRVWVVQEASAQKDGLTLLIDKFSFRFSDLVAVVEETNDRMRAELPSLDKRDQHPDGKSTYFAFLRACPAINSVGSRGADNLQELVQGFCTWGASDPRDKIFALLGLAKDASMYPAPSYNISSREIYKNFAKVWLSTGLPNVLSALSFAASDNSSFKDSSWVTDWEMLHTNNPVNPVRNNYKFCAGGSVNPTIPYTFDGQQLIVKGIQVDRIVMVGEPFYKNVLEDGRWLEQALSIIKKCRDTGGQSDLPEKEDLAHLLVLDGQSSLYGLTGQEGKWGQTLLDGGLGKDDGIGSRYSTFSSHGFRLYTGPAREYTRLGMSPYITAVENPSAWPKLVDGKGSTPDTEQAASKAYEDALWAINVNRRIFCTEKGRIGVGNYRVSVGNNVVVLQGARMPFITDQGVLPTDAGDDIFGHKVVSEAYVRGIMRGESLKDLAEFEDIFIV